MITSAWPSMPVIAPRALGNSCLQWQSQPLIILNAEAALACTRAGVTNDHVSRSLWLQARVPLSAYSAGGQAVLRDHRPAWLSRQPPPEDLPVAERS
ncbi:MAG: hypothetical protein HYU88_00775 [Chloroflexi bacterium]|nr:hypothetical protein [Chloroflexota bacterium]